MEKKLNFIYPFLFLIFGLFIFFHPMFFDFSKMPGNLGDARLISYLLDHGFLYITGDSLHSSFINAPFYYPYKNQLFYTDILFGGTIFYIPIRFLIKDTFSALQIWLILVSGLNFFSFFLVSKKVFKFSTLISSITAFLFAFSLPRFNQIEHFQLFLQFYSIFAFYFFITADKKIYRFILSAFFIFLQFITTFYFGWFTLFGIILAFIVSFICKNSRIVLFSYMNENKKGFIAFLLTLIFLLIPVAIKYLEVSTGFGYSDLYLFSPLSLFLSHSFLDNKIAPFNLSDFNQEQITGFGIFATAMVLGGLFSLKKYKFEISLFIFFVIIFFLFWQLNYFIYLVFPGASAIRASSRVIFLLVPIFCFLVGVCFQKLDKKYFIVFLIILLLEQIPVNNAFLWTKDEHIKRIERYEVPKECEIFGLADENVYDNVDAMFISNEFKKPTVNGYSGFLPEIKREILPKNCLIKTFE